MNLLRLCRAGQEPARPGGQEHRHRQDQGARRLVRGGDRHLDRRDRLARRPRSLGDHEEGRESQEHLGADTNIYVETEKAGTITARLFGEVHHAPGSTVYLSPEAGKVYRFDDSGKVIRG